MMTTEEILARFPRCLHRLAKLENTTDEELKAGRVWLWNRLVSKIQGTPNSDRQTASDRLDLAYCDYTIEITLKAQDEEDEVGA